MYKDIEKLRLKAQKAQCAYINAEEERKNRDVLPLLRKMLGKCFKYQNSYGGESKWWLYAKVVEVDEKNFQLKVVEFQRTPRGVEMRLETKFSYNGKLFFGKNSGYYPITQAEYNRAKKTLKKFITEKLEL